MQIRISFVCQIAVLSLFCTTLAVALETVVLEPVKDNTLFETAADVGEDQNEVSNGAGSWIFAGRTSLDGGFKLRRALIQFDLDAGLPDGATVVWAEIAMHQSKAAPGSPPADMGLHRVLEAWGEAGSDAVGGEGQGAFAEAGDATWHNRIYPDDEWNTPGGHYSPTISTHVTVGQSLQGYNWPCTSSLLGDIQYWQANSAMNFGWILVGGEASGTSGHRFGSREHQTQSERPRLTIIYRPASDIFDHGFEDNLCD